MNKIITDDFWIEAYKIFFNKRKILLGVSGSIAAYKSIELVRLLKKCGAEVKVILTDSAEKFVTPLTLETVSENKVYTSMWSGENMNHIQLAKWADVVLVAPATAHVISQLAQGAAAHLLTTEILATKAPVFIAPAMNPTMYAHPATQANIIKLNSYGYTILDPAHGMAACGDEGIGRMMEPEAMIENLASAFCEKSKQKLILINLGPTRSDLDPVRYFTNRSSGKMGAALAFTALKHGYHVEVIAGPTSVPLPKLARITRITTTDEMAGSVFAAFKDCDYFFSTAAVLDLEFDSFSEHKVKKDSIRTQIQFTETIDILKSIGDTKKKHQFILGFAAETENLITNAAKKLKSKNCDAVFVNPVKASSPHTGSGFESDQNSGILITKNKSQEFKIQNKHELAQALFHALKLD